MSAYWECPPHSAGRGGMNFCRNRQRYAFRGDRADIEANRRMQSTPDVRSSASDLLKQPVSARPGPQQPDILNACRGEPAQLGCIRV